jgi:hypothetical protein
MEHAKDAPHKLDDKFRHILRWEVAEKFGSWQKLFFMYVYEIACFTLFLGLPYISDDIGNISLRNVRLPTSNSDYYNLQKKPRICDQTDHYNLNYILKTTDPLSVK